MNRLHAGVVADLAAEFEEAPLDDASERDGAARWPAVVADVRAAEEGEQHRHGAIGPVVDEAW
jgi:hypothetical protein